MRSLEEVLKELKEAEKEYQEKCLKYGIQEKTKRKPKVEEEQTDQNEVGDGNTETNNVATKESNDEEISQDNQ